MYGKFFASTFSGSMFGAGPDVFAVWGYVIANAWDATVELNPALLAATLGTSPECVEAAIAFLTAPDPRSRNAAEQGRRLVHEGAFSYRVVSHELYRAIRSEDERRAYNRDAQRRCRAKRKDDASSVPSMTVNEMSALSAQTEAEAEADRIPPTPLAGGASAPPPKRKRKARAPDVPLPADWKPSDAHRAYAAQHGLDVELEADGLRGWAEGRTAVSWNGTFTTRLANAASWKRERGVGRTGLRSAGPVQPSHGRTGFENARIVR